MTAERTWRDLLVLTPRTIALVIAFVAIVTTLCLRYVVTAPPHRIVIAADAPDAFFSVTAKKYQTLLAAQGVHLDILTTNGSIDNLRLLTADHPTVDMAFVHGGLATAATAPNLESLGSVAYDPIWIVYRKALGDLGGVDKLRGLRIGTGRDGSGTHALALRVLTASGVTEAESHFTAADTSAMTDALLAGTLDAAFVMNPPESPQIRKLFNQESLKVMDLTEAEGLQRNLPFLHALTVPRGTIDLANEKPDQDLHIVASTTTVVVRNDVHPALLYLLMSVIDDVHEPPSLLHKENEFPSDKDVDLPLSPQAETYYKNGKPFLQRYLPFGLASVVERLLKIAVPVGLVVFPLVKAVPAILKWRVKRKLSKSYRQLLELERQVQMHKRAGTEGDRAAYDAQLREIEARVNTEKVPLLYSNELYVLREHIELARRQILQQTAPTPPPATNG